MAEASLEKIPNLSAKVDKFMFPSSKDMFSHAVKIDILECSMRRHCPGSLAKAKEMISELVVRKVS